MKKIMFTAIALVAFSGVSMGNTIIKDEVKKEKSKKNVKKRVLKTTPVQCMTGKFFCYNEAIADGWSSAEATTLSWQFYWSCMKEVF